MLDIPRPIQSALGIQTNDILTTSYNSGPYIVHRIHGPFTHFECTNSIVILDHPEISLTLLSPGALPPYRYKQAGQNNDRFVNPKKLYRASKATGENPAMLSVTELRVNTDLRRKDSPQALLTFHSNYTDEYLPLLRS